MRSCFTGVLLLTIVFILATHKLCAQFLYNYDQTVEVRNQSNNALKYPWVGGLNAGQFNTMDLNSDGEDDLVIYDRMGEKLLTFLSIENEFVYTPDYEDFFPEQIQRFLLLRDFNADGKKDIFTAHSFGIQVFKNVSDGSGLRFEQFYFFTGDSKSESLITLGFNNRWTSIQMRYDDLPAIVDADGDGDLDIFNVRYQGEGSVEYHKNFGMDRFGTPDSVLLERQTQIWGGFIQCKCENFVFNNEDCFVSGGRVKHGVGKALLAIDLNGDFHKDILYSEAECNNIFSLQNTGTVDNASVVERQYFPSAQPIETNVFPAAFYEDVDFDGIKDIVTAPNVFQRETAEQDMKSSTWYYKNAGTNDHPEFTIAKKPFMQDQMIDVGDNSVPAFFDIDNDRDLDLFVSYNQDLSGHGGIAYYQNIGSVSQPIFQFITEDFIELQTLLLRNIKLQIVDLTADGKNDFVFLATDPRSNKTSIYFIPYEDGYDNASMSTIDVPLLSVDNIHLTRISNDGLLDLLIGRSDGSLEYWRNVGSEKKPSFELSVKSYLGIGSTHLRQNIATYAGDLNADGNQDLIFADHLGQFFIIDNFTKRASGDTTVHANILYNSLLDNSFPVNIGGRAWPTIANVFDTERPQIISGNSLGGLRILKNTNSASDFNDLVLSVYPNPVDTDQNLKIRSNLDAMVVLYDATGKTITDEFIVTANTTNVFDISLLSSGLYIVKFRMQNGQTQKKLIVR